MKNYLQIGLIFIVSFLLYANTLNHNYAYDDTILITGNAFVEKGLDGIVDIYSYDTFQGYFNKNSSELVSGGRYRPFTLMMFAIEKQIWGLDPYVSHLINVLLYALLCVIVFLLLQALFKNHINENWKYFALIAALIFAFHPIHTEVVANIKSRDEIMALLCSLGAWLLIWKSDSLRNYLSAFVLFLIAAFSKESAMIFLLIVPFAFLILRSENYKSAIKKSWPIWAAGLLYLLTRILVIGFDFGNPSNELFNNPFLKYQGDQLLSFSFTERIATIFYSLGMYLKLLIFPHPLTHDYYPRQIGVMNFSSILVWISILAYGVMGYLIWRLRKNKALLSMALTIVILGLLIPSNLFFPIGTHMAERFAFISSLGFAIIFAYGLQMLNNKFGINWLYLLILIPILGLYGFKTFERNKAWKDNYTLMLTDAQTSTKSAKVLYAAAQEVSIRAYKLQDKNKKLEQIRISDDYLNDAIRIHPKIRKANEMLGNNRYALGQFEASIPYYEKALERKRNDQAIKTNLHRAYLETGKYYGETYNNFPEADKFLTKAYKINPKDFETLRLLGMTKVIRGRISESIPYLKETIALDPYVPLAYVTLGRVYRELGKEKEAIENFNKALNIDPNMQAEIDK